jgi:hypothetical protein
VVLRSTANFTVESSSSVVGATLAEVKSGGRRLLRTVLDRKTGLSFRFSRAKATGPKVGLDDSRSIKKRLTELLDVSPEPPIHETVIMAAEATIAIAAKVTLVMIDVHLFPVAAVAIVPAPFAADAPVAIAALTAIV